MALTAGMIGLAAHAASAVWMLHGCRFELVLADAQINQQPEAAPAFPGHIGRAGRTADLWGTWAEPGVLSAPAFAAQRAWARRWLSAAAAARGLNKI